MGWYLRKSLRMGPVRWNLSKSGIGMSVGVRGLRVGTGPRGPYVAGGRGGLYFRQSVGSRSRGSRSVHTARNGSHPYASPTSSMRVGSPTPAPVPFEYLPETQINTYSPASVDSLARYITSQRAHHSLFLWTVCALVIVNLIILGTAWPLAILAVPASIYGCYYVRGWDRRRTHVSLHYDLDAAEQQSYQHLQAGAQSLASAARLMRVEGRQVHGDWKRNAGATTALQLSFAKMQAPGSLPWLETNVSVWSLHWRQGRLALIFLPDRLLIEQGHVIAAVSYTEVQVTTNIGRFVERSTVPIDARILEYTWQYTNKDGGLDRRFKTNRRMPVIEATYIGFQNTSGLNLMLQASNREKAMAFVQSIRTFTPLHCAEPAAML